VLVSDADGQTATFDPASGTYTPGGSVPSVIDPEIVALQDGSVLIIGGGSRNVTRVDPSSGSVTEVGPMISARRYHTATVLADGRVLVVGGVTPSPDRFEPEPAAAEIFDPTNGP
jgi:streptogramin lyase